MIQKQLSIGDTVHKETKEKYITFIHYTLDDKISQAL